jgi:hypothetical protein
MQATVENGMNSIDKAESDIPSAAAQRVSAQIDVVLRLDLERRDTTEARRLLNAYLDALCGGPLTKHAH